MIPRGSRARIILEGIPRIDWYGQKSQSENQKRAKGSWRAIDCLLDLTKSDTISVLERSSLLVQPECIEVWQVWRLPSAP